MKKDSVLSIMISIVLVLIFYFISKIIPTVQIFIPGVLLSYILLTTFFKNNLPYPEKLLPLYLIAIAIQLVHFTEEYLTGFNVKISELVGNEVYDESSWIVFNMSAYAVFVLGAIVVNNKIKSLYIIPLFFIVVGVFLNTIGHILISIYVGGYFPGLYSVFLYVILAPFIYKALKN